MPESSLRLIFAGTPEFSAIHLKELIDSKHQLLSVYTQPDRPAGRGKKLQASPVKLLAEATAIPVCQPHSLKDPGEQEKLAALGADVLIVVAYGLILPQAVLDIPRLGCLNVHASLLPRWRGAAPIQRAIEAGDNETGVTIMQMDAGLDTGAMLATSRCSIGASTSAAELHDQLAVLGSPLLLDILDDLPAWQGRGQTQDEAQATYAHKILKPEAELDWRLDARELDLAIRAFNPFPVCFTTLQGERVKIWQATPLTGATTAQPGTILAADEQGILVACGTDQLLITQLQRPGGKVLSPAQLLNSRAQLFAPGVQFTSPTASQS